MLTHDEQRELLAIAREAITRALQNLPFEWKAPVSGGLAQPSGAFVTIRVDRQLHGCVGYIESLRSLSDIVAELAGKAALEDTRFPPLTMPELQRATLEISILSPIIPVTSTEEIEVGVHGLVLELGMHRGLLLPQVAVEHHWDRETFLEAVAQKSGLYKSAWKDSEARLHKFTAEIVEEAEVLK